ARSALAPSISTARRIHHTAAQMRRLPRTILWSATIVVGATIGSAGTDNFREGDRPYWSSSVTPKRKAGRCEPS
ncbi:hypothetical protein PMAYCL1PPCAC_27986, partial [Pristionchus mayeri]